MMEHKEIDALEPKYTGNQRDLTEGEATAIKADPNYKGEEGGPKGILDDLPTAGLLGLYKRT